MSNELSVPNLAEAIRDKVRVSIVGMIPDNQIDGLVKKEWESFFLPSKPNNWSSDISPSSFQLLVKAEIQKHMEQKVREAVDAELQKFNQTVYDAKGQEALKQMISLYAPSVLEGISTNIVNQTLQRIQQQRPY